MRSDSVYVLLSLAVQRRVAKGGLCQCAVKMIFGFLNVRGYYDPLREMMRRIAGEGFVGAQYVDMLVFEERIEPMVERFRSYRAPPPKWATPPPS